MNKNLHSFARIAFIAILAFSARFASGQIVFTSVPDSVAVLNELYTYDVNVAANPPAVTFSLTTAPAGMAINSSTGIITWTPASMTAGGQVQIKAHNTQGDYFQNYFIFITNAVVCDTSLVSYWPMDSKTGSSLPEVIHGYNALWEGQPGPEPAINDNAMVGKSVKFAPTSNLDWGYNVRDNGQYQYKGEVQFSVAFWFKNQPTLIDPPIHPSTFVGKWDGEAFNDMGWIIQWNPATEQMEFWMGDHSTTDTTLVNSVTITQDDTDWHHVVATFYNGSDLQQKAYMHLFVDGVSSEMQYDFYTDNFDGIGDLNIGYYYAGSQPFSGLMDELTVWKKELLADDVIRLYDAGNAHEGICHEGDVAPIISSTPVTEASEDIAYTYQFTYRAMQGSPVIMSAPVLPSWLTFNTNTGVLSGTPTNSNTGNQDVTLRITSGTVVIEQAFTIAVANVNDAPVITSTPGTTGSVDALYTYVISATDEDGDALTYSAPTLPSWLSFDAAQKLLVGIPEQADKGDNNVTLAVSDGIVTVPQSFVIQVLGPTGINDKSASFAKVYPVPASEYINFDFAERLDKAELQIFSTSGSLIKKQDVSNLNSYRLDVKDLKPNNYIYRISTAKGLQTGPIVVK
jgi:hypothetical protein